MAPHQHHLGHSPEDDARYEKDLMLYFSKFISTFKWDKKNENILDIGCGDGRTGYKYILPEVLKYESKLYSVELNEKKIETARKDYAHPSITYAVGNILKEFPFGDVKFDKIFAIYVLCFMFFPRLPETTKAIRKLHGLLKSGGQIAFSIHKGNGFIKILHKLMESEKWKMYSEDCEKFFNDALSDTETTVQILKKTMEEIGFKIVMAESDALEHKFDDITEFLNKEIKHIPFFAKIPEDLKDELMEDFRTAATQVGDLPRDTKQFSFQYSTIALVVERTN